MDHHIKSFLRVLRELDDADELIRAFSKWENTTLSVPDQWRLLDFPGPQTQAANIAASSTLTKANLLKRAAEAPSQLSAAEVDLLRNRYWLNISPDEQSKICSAHGLISGPHRISEAEFEHAGRRLKAARRPFYSENEEKAIDNAVAEHGRRELDAFRASQMEDAERHVARAASPWVRRMWEEDRGEVHWGYGVFVDPGAFVDEDEAEEYMVRRDGVLFHARGAVGVGSSMVGSMWKLQRLDWPGLGATECVDREEHLDGTPTARGSGPGADQDASEHSRAVEFQRLRDHFKSILDRAPTKQSQERANTRTPAQPERRGLCEGLLQNVFLVIDKDSAASVLSPSGFVDDMWAWAVDPDFNDLQTRAEQSSSPPPTTTTITACVEGAPPPGRSSRYPGYVRVRLQQLVHRFYEARRFRGSAYPMAALWAAAQTSKHRAFVSLEEDEARSWGMDRSVGSAMRAQPPRVVYGPAKKTVAPAESDE